MPFNVVKQPLIPAFFTLLVLLVVGLLRTTEPSLDSVTMDDGLRGAGLTLPALDRLLLVFQLRFPHLSHWIGGLLALYTGISLGRLTLRYNLYGTGTCLAISLYGVTLLGTMRSGEFFPAIVSSMLLMLAFKNYCLSYCNGFGFDRIFRGSLFISLLVLVYPAAAPLILLLFFVVRLFNRTTRELIVALAGLLFPIALLCYLNWALGGSLMAPLVNWYGAYMSGEWGGVVLHATLVEQIYCAVLLVVTLFSLALFRTNRYNVNTKARHILRLCGRLLLLTLCTFAMPAASTVSLALMAVPVTLLLPVLFIRVHQPLAQTLYPLLLAASVAALFVA